MRTKTVVLFTRDELLTMLNEGRIIMNNGVTVVEYEMEELEESK